MRWAWGYGRIYDYWISNEDYGSYCGKIVLRIKRVMLYIAFVMIFFDGYKAGGKPDYINNRREMMASDVYW